MDLFMMGQLILSSERLFTNITYIWPFPCMDPFMGCQPMFPSKYLFTDITIIQFFTSMDSKVSG